MCFLLFLNDINQANTLSWGQFLRIFPENMWYHTYIWTWHLLQNFKKFSSLFFIHSFNPFLLSVYWLNANHILHANYPVNYLCRLEVIRLVLKILCNPLTLPTLWASVFYSASQGCIWAQMTFIYTVDILCKWEVSILGTQGVRCWGKT